MANDAAEGRRDRSALASLVLRRGAAALVLLALVLTATFFLLHLAPGDPLQIVADPRISVEQRDRLRRLYGLDRPPLEQYLAWMAAAARGDWGISYLHQRPAARVIAEALPNTLVLAAAALPLQYGLGIWLGVAAARRARQRADHLIRAGSLLLYSLPIFWLGLMAILLLAVRWPIFPAGHMWSVGAEELSWSGRALDLLRHLALPAGVLALSTSGGIARFVRNALLETLGEDYIRAARARGLGEPRVVWRHALRNALPPLLQVFGLQLAQLLSGALVVEVVFAWPGLGRLAYEGILGRDYPVVLATTALAGIAVVVGSLAADLLHAAADPRVRRA
jgi:peptide/nickel transport system permease protein